MAVRHVQAVLIVWTMASLANGVEQPRAKQKPQEPRETQPAQRSPAVAVPADLKADMAYTHYAAMLIHIDLLSNPETADLPIQVDARETGTVRIAGSAPSPQHKSYVLDNARRISGLAIRDELRVARQNRKPTPPADSPQLASDAKESIAALFPELGKQLDVSVGDEGVVVITGSVDSMQAKLLLSQSVKSQLGCVAVANITTIRPAEPGRLRITEDGSLTLALNQIPEVPAAEPFQPISAAKVGVHRADDAPDRQALGADDDFATEMPDQQIHKDIRNELASAPELVDAGLEIEVRSGVVLLSGDVANRDLVQKAVDRASAVRGVSKVVAKCKPVSIQRNVPGQSHGSAGAAGPNTAAHRNRTLLDSVVPAFLRGDRKTGTEPDKGITNSRRFRDTVYKTLKKRCGDRVSGLKVRNGLHGMTIEAEVKNLRDRTFVMKQIDNIVELQQIAYDAAVTINEK